LLTPGQAAKIDALKSASPDFTAMRRLAMRFRGILRSKDIHKFDVWLNDAQQSGIYAIHRFARTIRRDIDAVRNALTEGWSNGQTEGQINRLKTLERAMYGRAGAELLRAPGCCRFICQSITEFEDNPVYLRIWQSRFSRLSASLGHNRRILTIKCQPTGATLNRTATSYDESLVILSETVSRLQRTTIPPHKTKTSGWNPS